MNDIFPGVEDPGPKRFFEGTHRLLPPEQSFARLQAVQAELGISRVANITGLDTIGIPVVMAVRPASRSLSVSQGKGSSLVAAKVSALMESVESYHAERFSGPLLYESRDRLRASHDVIDLDGLVYNPGASLAPELPILWVSGYDLIQQRWVQVPHEAVHTDFTLRMRAIGGVFLQSSNGLAAGNHLLEAISHGICEVVERDACASWLSSARRLSTEDRIAMETVTDTALLRMIEQCQKAGMYAALWDMRSRFNIPSVYCEVIGPMNDVTRPPFAACGSGSHAAREVACLRALSEAVQSRATLISGSREDMPHSTYEQSLATTGLHSRVEGLAGQVAGQTFGGLPSRMFEGFSVEIGWYLEQLCAAGIGSAVVVNLTQEAFSIPVVRVIIPGMQFGED